MSFPAVDAKFVSDVFGSKRSPWPRPQGRADALPIDALFPLNPPLGGSPLLWIAYDGAEDPDSSDAWSPIVKNWAVKNWARVHLFRIGTAVLTLALLGLCFFYSPDLLTWWLRATMRIIEAVAGLLPYPWSDRVEIAMKALGGSFWFLITSAIIMVRVACWLVAAGWRHRPASRRGPGT
jgi:hypothetical protein